MEQARALLKRAFPEGSIADYRETHPIITRGLDRATTFLSLVSLIALIVGALGVGAAIDGHLRQKMDTIAILKCVGARSGQVVRIFAAQTLMLGAAGGLLGAALGALVERVFPALLARYLPLEARLRVGARRRRSKGSPSGSPSRCCSRCRRCSAFATSGRR